MLLKHSQSIRTDFSENHGMVWVGGTYRSPNSSSPAVGRDTLKKVFLNLIKKHLPSLRAMLVHTEGKWTPHRSVQKNTMETLSIPLGNKWGSICTPCVRNCHSCDPPQMSDIKADLRVSCCIHLTVHWVLLGLRSFSS